eukprot:9628074-Lingulodinium_polyedra.AAC.1
MAREALQISTCGMGVAIKCGRRPFMAPNSGTHINAPGQITVAMPKQQIVSARTAHKNKGPTSR